MGTGDGVDLRVYGQWSMEEIVDGTGAETQNTMEFRLSAHNIEQYICTFKIF